MEYITGIHALNLNCAIETCGDWHQSALRWEKIHKEKTEERFFNLVLKRIPPLQARMR